MRLEGALERGLDLGLGDPARGAQDGDLHPPAGLDLAQPQGRDGIGDPARLDRPRRAQGRGTKQRVALDLRGGAFHEVAERQHVAARGHVAAQTQNRGLLRQHLPDEQGEGEDREQDAADGGGAHRRDPDGAYGGDLAKGVHGQEPGQLRNIWEVVESIWSAAVTTFEFIS